MLAYATLLSLQARFPDLMTITAEWLSTRTDQHWSARRLLEATEWRDPWTQVRTRIAHLQDATLWALQVNTRDPRLPRRHWQLDLALRDLEQGGVQATVTVRATDDKRLPSASASVPTSQPALVRLLLERGQPDPETPGLRALVLTQAEDVQRLVRRIGEPRRAQVLLIVGGDATLDVPALRATLTGLADVAELRPGVADELAATLKTAGAWPPPGRAAVFPPRTPMARPAGQERRQILGAETRTLVAAALRLGAPRVLAAHHSVERLKDASLTAALDDV